MITEDELKKYLPKYLSEENYKTLLAELKSFPYNIDGRMYTSMLDKNVIFQGDGLKKMPIIDLVNIERGVKNVSCLILSRKTIESSIWEFAGRKIIWVIFCCLRSEMWFSILLLLTPCF